MAREGDGMLDLKVGMVVKVRFPMMEPDGTMPEYTFHLMQITSIDKYVWGHIVDKYSHRLSAASTGVLPENVVSVVDVGSL